MRANPAKFPVNTFNNSCSTRYKMLKYNEPQELNGKQAGLYSELWSV